MFRRHLGLHPHETDDLPWWLFRLYSEEMVEEFRRRDPEEEEDENATIIESDDISGLGINVQQLK